jgi:hypothetical protein
VPKNRRRKMKEALGGLLIQAAILIVPAVAGETYFHFYPPKEIVEMDGATMTIEELLDEVDQNPTNEFEIDRNTFELFSKMLDQHGFRFNVITASPETIRCRIMRKAY